MNTSLYGDIIEIGPDGQPITPTLTLANRNGEKKGVITNVKALLIQTILMKQQKSHLMFIKL
mgnify:CR=1 FL=1